MSKYLKVAVLIVFGVSFLGAEDLKLPSLNELKSKINKDRKSYNYVEINNQSEYDDLVKERGENLGLSLQNSENRQAINVVKIRNVTDREKYLTNKGKYLHHSSSNSNTNLGLEYIGDVSNKDIINVVKIENSSLGSSNSGISVSTDTSVSNTSIQSNTTIINSSLRND